MKKKLSFLCAIFMMVLMLVVSPGQAFALEVEAIEDTEAIEEEIVAEEETETEEVIAEEEASDVDVIYVSSIPITAEWSLDCHGVCIPSTTAAGCVITEVKYIKNGIAYYGDEITPGDTYNVKFTVKLLSGYAFSSNCHAYWNGMQESAKVTINDTTDTALNFVYKNVTVPKPELINSVIITGLDEPVVGKHPDFTANLITDNGTANIADIVWYRYKTGVYSAFKELSSSDSFEKGYKYYCLIKVCAEGRACFPSYDTLDEDDYAVNIYDGTVTINGTELERMRCHSDNDQILSLFWYVDVDGSESSVPEIGYVGLSQSVYEYDGSAKTPKVIVEDIIGRIVSTDYYTVKRSSGRKEVGTYTYKVVFNAPISETYTLTFKINPAKVATVKTENTSSGIKVSWSAAKGATRYLVYRRDNGGSYVKVNSTTGRSFTDTTANVNGRKYDYRIYSYKLVDGVAYKGAGSNTKTYYYIKRPAITSFTSSAATRGVVKWSANTKATGYQIQYCLKSDYSSGSKTVTVSSASTVTKTLTGLTSGKRYYVRMRAYKTVGSAKYYSAWTGSKYVTVK